MANNRHLSKKLKNRSNSFSHLKCLRLPAIKGNAEGTENREAKPKTYIANPWVMAPLANGHGPHWPLSYLSNAFDRSV